MAESDEILLNLPVDTGDSPGEVLTQDNPVIGDCSLQTADNVVQLVSEKFSQLCSRPSGAIPEWRNAAAVLTKDGGKIRLHSLATGTKCVGIDGVIASRGCAVADLHAEVLARRAFVRFLLDDIEAVVDGREHSVVGFVEAREGPRRFTIKDGVSLIFFTSHTPCGDASVMPLVEPDGEGSPPKRLRPSTSSDDIHRTGAKCTPQSELQDARLPGAAYHVLGAFRMKPGRGHPSLSMSCSDKLLRWNALGLQGAWLSCLFEKPLRPDLIVVGGDCPFSESACRRAMIDRNTGYTGSSAQPQIVQARVPFSAGKYALRQNAEGRPADDCTVWIAGAAKMETLIASGYLRGTTKKSVGKLSSRSAVCRRSLLERTLPLLQKTGYDRHITQHSSEDLDKMSYTQLKAQIGADYSKHWQELRTFYKCWIDDERKREAQGFSLAERQSR